jgi:hypothetical protein
MRKLDEAEMLLLRQTNAMAPVALTEEELQALANGEGSFKCFNVAEKRLKQIKEQMRMAISRQEAYDRFVTFETLNMWAANELGEKLHRIDVVIEALITAGAIDAVDLKAASEKILAARNAAIEAAATTQLAEKSIAPAEGKDGESA